MPRFLVEVPHEADAVACARAVEVLLETGSHYLTNAEFGCLDGDHRAWILVDCDTKDEARQMLPSLYRQQARIVGLNRFSLEHIQLYLKKHGG